MKSKPVPALRYCFRVIKGKVSARQRIERLDEVEAAGDLIDADMPDEMQA